MRDYTIPLKKLPRDVVGKIMKLLKVDDYAEEGDNIVLSETVYEQLKADLWSMHKLDLGKYTVQDSVNDKASEADVKAYIAKLWKVVPYAVNIYAVSHTGVSITVNESKLHKASEALHKAGYDAEEWDDDEIIVWAKGITFDDSCDNDCEDAIVNPIGNVKYDDRVMKQIFDELDSDSIAKVSENIKLCLPRHGAKIERIRFADDTIELLWNYKGYSGHSIILAKSVRNGVHMLAEDLASAIYHKDTLHDSVEDTLVKPSEELIAAVKWLLNGAGFTATFKGYTLFDRAEFRIVSERDGFMDDDRRALADYARKLDQICKYCDKQKSPATYNIGIYDSRISGYFHVDKTYVKDSVNDETVNDSEASDIVSAIRKQYPQVKVHQTAKQAGKSGSMYVSLTFENAPYQEDFDQVRDNEWKRFLRYIIKKYTGFDDNYVSNGHATFMTSAKDSVEDSTVKATDNIVVKKSSGEKFKIVKVPGDGYVYMTSLFDSRTVKAVEDDFNEKYAPEASKKKLKKK